MSELKSGEFEKGTMVYWNKCSLCKRKFLGSIKDKDLICINCLEHLDKQKSGQE